MDAKSMGSDCDFSGIKPVMMELPYPPLEVTAKNPSYAELLTVDYCGVVSELSSVAQYINNENRLACEKCSIAKTLLGMAICEMIHMQKLGVLITLLGGNISYTANGRNGRPTVWTPSSLNLPSVCSEMLEADIETEISVINQYEMHISWIQDERVNAVLRRMIQDEEYHIMMLRTLAKEL